MADLSLADALTEPPPEIEGEIKRDFMATLEAEAYDDVVGETVGKTDYIPLLDVDEKTGNSESKKKSCPDTSQGEGTPSSKPAVLANGDHGIKENDTPGLPTEFLEETMAYPGYHNSQDWPESTNFCFEPEPVVNPVQTDFFQMHHDDGLEDLLFYPSGTTNASAFIDQNNPVKDSYGLFACDTFAPAAVVPQGWPVEAPDSAHLGVFISPEAAQPLQPIAEPVEVVEMAEERSPTEALETVMGLKAANMAPSRETEMAPVKDTAAATETEVALARDVQLPTKEYVVLAKDMESTIESDMALVKDIVLPVETEEALVKDVILPTKTEEAPVKSGILFKEMEEAPVKDEILFKEMEETPVKDGILFKEMEEAPVKDGILFKEMEEAPVKDGMLFKETEKIPPIKMDLAPAEGIVPPISREMAPTKGVVSPSEIEMALPKDIGSSTEIEISLAKELALSSEIEVAPVKDMVSSTETEVAPVKDMVSSTEIEVAPVKDMVSSTETEVALVKGMTPPPEIEVTLDKHVAAPQEKEVALVKDMASPPEREMALGKNVPRPPEVAMAKDVVPPSETEVAPVPVQDRKVVWTQNEISEDSQLESLLNEEHSAIPTSMILPELVSTTGQKYNLPTNEESVLEKLEQKKPFSTQPSERSPETAGTPLTQVKQVCRPSDRKAAWPRPARVPPELLGGSSPQKTLDPGLGPCSLSESVWVCGSSSCSEPGNQRKTIHVDFLESQRDLGREAWAMESTAMMMKKKKKKPKQKRYSQPRAGGPWDGDSAKEPKGHPFAADTQKSGVLPSLSTTMDIEYGLTSRENLKKECEIDFRAAKPIAENFVSGSLDVPLCPLEEPLKTAINSQPELRVGTEVKGNKAGPQSQDKKLLQRDKCTAMDKSENIGSLKQKGSLTEVTAHKVEIPLEIRPKEGCSPVLDQESVGGFSKPIAAKELLSLIPTLTASNPLESSLKEGDDERKMTNLQSDKQKEFSEGAEEVKELKKEAFPKQREEMSTLASEQPQDKVIVKFPGAGKEPVKRMAGDGKSRRGRESSRKARVSSGKVRARAELSYLPDSQEDGRAVLGPCEPASNIGRMTAKDKSEELGLDSSKQPGIMADLPEAVVMREPKEMTGPSVASILQALIPLGNESGMTQTSGGRTESGAVALDRGVSNQSKERKCPWMDCEAAPWISEKSKKGGNEGKNKKVKNNYSTQAARVESKEEILSPPIVGKDEDAGNPPHENKELGLTFPIHHEPLFSHTSDTPTVQVVDQKGRNVKVNSFEFGALDGSKNIVSDSAINEAATKVTDLSCQDQTQGSGFVSSVLPEEHKTDAAKGHTAEADKPSKRSSDGKSKKVKNSFPKKHILENKIDATKIHVPFEATGIHKIEGMGYVDENRNITFTYPRIPPGGMGKSDAVVALDSAACDKLPISAPQVAKEGDSFPDTCAERRQETAPVHISTLLMVDNCSKNGVPDQGIPKAPLPIVPSTGTGGGTLTFTSSTETIDSPRDDCYKNKGGLAVPVKYEAGLEGEHVTGNPEFLPSGPEHSVGKTTDLAKKHLPGVPVGDQNLPGEVTGLEACADRSNFPTYPVNKKTECEEDSAAVQISNLPGDKGKKPYENQNPEGEESRVLANLKKEVDMTPLPPKNEKNKLEVISPASKITKLEGVFFPTPELQSEFLEGEVETTPSRVVDKLAVTASKPLQLPDPKDRLSEAPENMTEKPEPKALGEGKEDKSRMAEPMKGYMRPTKSRGPPSTLRKSPIQELERAKQAKPSGGVKAPVARVGRAVKETMSLSDRQPASSTAACSQLCQGKPAECLMDSPKEIRSAGFEWQRTEGKLNEIGLNVSVDRQLKDGLMKNACFLEPNKLCFFEGKLDKELGVDVQDKEHPASSGHLERYVISDSCHSSEGSFMHQKTAGFQLGPGEGPDKNKATTVPGMVAGKNGPETMSQPALDLPGAADLPVKEQETSVWNPNFHSVTPGCQGPREASPREENGISAGCRMIGVGSECGSSLPVAVTPPTPTATPPVTMVESTQEYLNASFHVRDHKELEKLSSTEEGALFGQGPQQKKAMHRALSECSHLSVPPAVNLADKYPEVPAREELSAGLIPLPSSPVPVPTPRKLGAPAVRRSMTVAEEQTAGYGLNPGDLPVLSTEKIPPSICEERVTTKGEELTHFSTNSCSSSSGKRELDTVGLHLHGNVEQFPEVSSKEKGQEDVSGTRPDSCPQVRQRGEKQPGQAALAGEKEIEVSATQSSPSFPSEETPCDGIAKPEEGRPTVNVTGNDITAPPNKELPPSPEKKTKPLATTQLAKTSTLKAKTQPTSLPKQPAPTTFGGSTKKPMSLASGSVPATLPKRPAAATARPSIPPSKDVKSKPGAEAKIPEKKTTPEKKATSVKLAMPSKPASAPAFRPGSKSTQTFPKATASASVASAGPSSRSTLISLPKKPAGIKTEGKPTDVKKTATKSAPADLSRLKSTSSSAVRKNATGPGTASAAGMAPSRVKPTPMPTRPSGISAIDRKPTSTRPSSSAPRLSRPASSASAPDLKNVRAKVGSTENIKHQPGGGRAKVEGKTEAAATARKPEPNAVPKAAGPGASVQKPPAGKVQIVSKKLNYSHIQSKCGSKDNIKHVPGGGNVQIQNKKVDISKVSSKCGSKANIKHKPGGGDVKIESQKLNFKEKAQAKVGSLDNVGHLPAGGAIKTEGGGSETPPCPGPPAGEEPVIPEAAPEAGAPTSASGLSGHTTLAGGGDQREAQTLDCQIQETSI